MQFDSNFKIDFPISLHVLNHDTAPEPGEAQDNFRWWRLQRNEVAAGSPASATANSFPGMYSATGLNLIMRMSRRWHLAGVWSRSLELISGINGLWPICNTKEGSPWRYLENFSHAQAQPNNSFSICAYRCLVGVRVLEQYATGFQPSWCCCIRMPPKP